MLLAYVVRILTQWAKENPNAKSLPAVIPIVVHHGPKPWQTPVSLRDLIAVPTGPLELRFREMSAVARLTLLFLQHIRSLPVDDALAAIVRWRDLVAMVAVNPTGQAALLPLWSWLLRVTGVEPEQLRDVAARISPSTEATVTNAADRLIAKGLAATLLRLRTRRFGPLPDEIVARIHDRSPEDFDRWADRVLDANTLDDVFAT